MDNIIKIKLFFDNKIISEHDLERLENEGIDTIPKEEKEQFQKDKEYLQESDSLAKHTAKHIIDNGSFVFLTTCFSNKG